MFINDLIIFPYKVAYGCKNLLIVLGKIIHDSLPAFDQNRESAQGSSVLSS